MTAYLAKVLRIEVGYTRFDPMSARNAVQFHVILHLIEPTFNDDYCSSILKLG